MRILYGFLIFSLGLFMAVATNTALANKWYDSKVKVAATKPLANVDSLVYYSVHSSPARASRPLKSCVLIHGHGMGGQVMPYFYKGVGKTMGDIAMPGMDIALLQSTLNTGDLARYLPPNGAVAKYQQQLARLSAMSVPEFFGTMYYGEQLFYYLAEQKCDRLFVTVQESVQSSVFEMTIRTERFLRDVACPASSNQSCAIIGHSKGGAVVSNIVRRCMTGVDSSRDNLATIFDGSSRLGASSCKAIKHAISLAGANEGVGLSMLLFGSKTLLETRQDSLNSSNSLERMFAQTLDQSGMFQDGLKRYNGMKRIEEKTKIDLFGDKNADTNPIWYDLGPLSPQEYVTGDKQNPSRRLTLGEALGPTFQVKRQGFFGGQYSAYAGNYPFKLGKDATNAITCGPMTAIPARPKPLAGRFNLNNGQGPGLRDRLLEGALSKALGQQPDQATVNPTEVSAETTEMKEKIKKEILAVSETPIMDFLWEPFLLTEHIGCRLASLQFNSMWAEPSLPMALSTGVNSLKNYGIKNNLIDAKSAETVFSRYTVETKETSTKIASPVFVNHSDGMVESAVALGICKRSSEGQTPNPAIGECRSFEGMNHLGISGMSSIVAGAVLAILK
jgi:hypothetical protein